MKKSGRRYFTPDEYRRLARNPFVDKKTLQFIKNKTVGQSATDPVGGRPQTVNSATTFRDTSPQRNVRMSEEAAQLVAKAIQAMLRE